MRKRFLSVLLTLCMVLTMLPLASFAAGEEPNFVAVPQNEEIYGKQVSTYQGNDLAITKNATSDEYDVTGTLTKVEEKWETFNESVEFEQTGYYMAICIPKTCNSQEITKMVLPGVDAQQNPVEKVYVKLPASGEFSLDAAFTDKTSSTASAADCCYIIFHLDHTQTADKQKITVKLAYGENAEVTDYTFNYSQLIPKIGIAEVELDLAEVTAATTINNLPNATVKSVTLTGEDSAITTDTDTYVSVVTKWTDESNNALTTLVAGGTIKYTIEVTAAGGYELDENISLKLGTATETGSAISGTVTVPEATKEQYTIKFAGNGSSNTINDVKVDKESTGDTEYTITESFAAPANKVFDKWTVTPSTVTVSGNKLTIPANTETTTEITLTANWKDAPYTIKFEANGGDGTMADATVDKNANGGDTEYTINGSFTAPADKVFDKWTVSPSTVTVSGNKLTIPASVAAGTEITLTAAWKDVGANDYVINFNAGDGTGTMAAQTVTKADSGATTYTIPDCTFTAPAGKTFNKWTTTAADVTIDGKTLTIPASVAAGTTITLTATWKYLPPTLTIQAVENQELNIFGKKPSEMGKFEIGTPDKDNKIIVTGSATYISDYTGFNSSVPAEQKGHYLAIQIEGNEGDKITITNVSSGAAAPAGKELTFGADGSLEMAVWLSGDRAAGQEKEFTISITKNELTTTYTVNFTQVVLLPETKVEGDTAKVEVTEAEVDSLTNLINDNTASGTTDANAPVKVEGTGSNKTLTFTGTDGTSATKQDNTEVTLPQNLVNALGGNDAKADVKVESSSGSVKVPSETLAGAKDNDVVIKVEKTTVSASGLTVGGGAVSSELTSAINGKDAVSVTVKAKDGTNLVTNATGSKAVTVTINGLTPGTSYVVLCISDSNAVTSFGEYTPTGTSITIGTTHLTTFVPIEKTSANADTLAEVPADSGKASTINIGFTAATNSIGPKATVTGLTGSGTVTVQVAKAANTAPAVVFTMTADGNGEVEFNATAGSEVTVWNGTVTFTGGKPSGSIPDFATETAP